MRLSLNQRGLSNVLFPLIILAAIGLGVYLVQQQTEFTPSAQEVNPPTGCRKITPVSRSVCYKKSADSPPEQCQQDPELDGEGRNDHPDYPIKEVTWTFSNGWKNVSGKGAVQEDGDRMDLGSMPPRFDSPGGKSFEEIDNDPISSNGSTRDGNKISYRVRGGQAVVAEFAFTTEGTNFQGVQGKKYDHTKSYAFVPENENSSVRCDGVGSTSTGTRNNNQSCSGPSDCKSGRCSNRTCVQGNKAGGASCTNKEECTSNTCTNGKCEGGTRSTGQTCDEDDECASNRCDNQTNRCVSATSPSPRSTSSPRPSSSSSSSIGGGGGASTAPGASFPSSPAPSASATASTSPAPSGSITPVPVSLTKSEIVGFRNSYNALDARLGAASSSGNLNITATIAKTELDSIVSQLPTCPDDANVGTCLDQKFRTRFDFAKTAARLTAFYAIYNNVSGLCVKSDFGLNPLITATSQNNAQGRVNLCTEPTAAQKIWRIFTNGRFEPVLSTDTRWPANPTCANLPQDIMSHYRNAEKLFETQSGFIANTACDGITTFEPPGGTT